MAALASVKPRRCQPALQAVRLEATGYAGKEGDGWENFHLHSLATAARVLPVTEALHLSLFLSQVLFLVPDCKNCRAQTWKVCV